MKDIHKSSATPINSYLHYHHHYHHVKIYIATKRRLVFHLGPRLLLFDILSVMTAKFIECQTCRIQRDIKIFIFFSHSKRKIVNVIQLNIERNLSLSVDQKQTNMMSHPEDEEAHSITVLKSHASVSFTFFRPLKLKKIKFYRNCFTYLVFWIIKT